MTDTPLAAEEQRLINKSVSSLPEDALTAEEIAILDAIFARNLPKGF
jgi:hypothetical protein